MNEFVTWIISNLDWILESAMMLVGGFAVVATQTPNQSDNKILQMTLSFINFLGANVGKATNEE
tara:strand:- start:5385 stop:5576 length:192 start_codon:yes stop_codon:yes gene_type:complete